VIRAELREIVSFDIPMIMITDSQCHFDVLTRCRYTTERRLMVDIVAAREAYNSQISHNIGLIQGAHNHADDLNKIGGNGALMDSVAK
jgi:hypothetical protein